MSIATAITNAQNKVAAAYTAIGNKGGTLPATQNLSNLPTAIASIPSGGGGGTDNLPAFVSAGVSTFTDNTITKIRDYAFYNSSSNYMQNPITSISCQNVTEIGSGAFSGAKSLQSASFPSLVSTSNSAFYNCTALTSFAIPNTMRIIGSNMFSGCTGITEFTVPSGVTSIATYAFNGCTNVEEFNYNATNAAFTSSSSSNGVFSSLGKNKNNLVFNIGSNVESIPAYFLYGTTTATNLPHIATLNIPNNNSISSIGAHAFYQCSGLSGSLSFPNITSLTESMESAFYATNITSLDLSNLTSNNGNSMKNLVSACANLTTLNLSSLVSLTGTNAAYQIALNCSNLSQVNLSSLSSITGTTCLGSAFRGCTNLASLSFPSLTSTSFGSYTNQFNKMLQGVTGCTVHFPSNLQSVIGSWSDVTAGFGGTNTSVLFDLPATT